MNKLEQEGGNEEDTRERVGGSGRGEKEGEEGREGEGRRRESAGERR